MVWFLVHHGEAIETFGSWSAAVHAAHELLGAEWDGFSTPRLPSSTRIVLGGAA